MENPTIDVNAMKAEMAKKKQIAELKYRLKAMDYKTSKHADGEYTAAEWSAIVTERQAIRAAIHQLEDNIQP